MKKIYSFIFTGVLIFNVAKSQDLHYSQYLSSPLNLNPAMTGTCNEDLRVVSNYRNQWKSVSANPFRTISVSIDGTLPPKKKTNDFWGIGLVVNNDKAGASEMSLTAAALSMSYSKSLNPRNGTLLTFGVSAGGGQKSIKYDNLTWDKQYDGVSFNPNAPSGESPIGNSLTYLDISAGVGFNTQIGKNVRFNAGTSLWHINRPDISLSKVAKDKIFMKYELHVAAQITMAKHPGTSFIPSAVYFQQGPQKLINVGCAVRYRLVEQSHYTGWVDEIALVLGGYYRVQDAAFVNVRLDYAGFSVGVNYDINVSTLSPASSNRGGLEFCLMWKKTLLNKSKFNPKNGIKMVQF